MRVAMSPAIRAGILREDGPDAGLSPVPTFPGYAAPEPRTGCLGSRPKERGENNGEKRKKKIGNTDDVSLLARN